MVRFCICAGAALCALSSPVMAQNGEGDYYPASGLTKTTSPTTPPTSPPAAAHMDGVETHPALRLTPDKSTIVRLDRPAGSLIIGNETHLNILLDSPMTLILSPRAPGATYFTVLDEQRRVIMQRHVLIAAPEKRYLRIRRTCNTSVPGCRPTSVYYCPDMCHEVNIDGNVAASAQGAVSGGAINTQGGDTMVTAPAPETAPY